MLAATNPAREKLALRLQEARARTDELFRIVHPAAIYRRPVPDRHRLMFYLGHLEAFDWNQICRNALGVPSFQPEFDRLFEFGIDPEPGRAPADTEADWPSRDRVERYNRKARQIIDERLADTPEEILQVAIEHRLMHAETFAYLLHNLPYQDKLALESSPSPAGPAPAAQWIEIPPREAVLGRKRGDGFGWDNEFDEHVVSVQAFRLAKYKVTNGEYLEFVFSGGTAPHYWAARDGQWLYQGMFREMPLPLDWPVYATWEQAVAYAQWRGKRLMSEAEFHSAAGSGLYPWGDTPPMPGRGNFDFERWDPVPVNATPDGDSEHGVAQLFGNGWEWTSTVFAPFAGFQAFPFYPGYSANFFDGRHYVLKGAAPRTAACLLRKSFRNWFRPNYPYVQASFRLAEDC
jgi:gamma-glutamyl hercynylcysteine S-oxide synthase